mmetsp:Transcript_13949/g.38571  ORF Transcript_13949/g.38571 Transcript_13949/m.38571 type:complete len:253 (+) Transcript_13949:104-862(+)
MMFDAQQQPARTFLRALNEEDSNYSSTSASIDPKVFWPVNAFILCLVVGACVFYCKGGFGWLQNSRENSDRAYAATVQRRQEAERERRRGSPEKRKKLLKKSFKKNNVEMIVEEGDLVFDDSKKDAKEGEEASSGIVEVDNDDGDDEELGAGGYLMLRETPQDEFTVRRKVPNCCAICLGEYEIGDRVVWSSNDECQHAFHMDCLMDWLTKMRDGTPCPCCRAEFTDVEAIRKEQRIQWSAGSTFNPSAVSF